MKHLLTHYLGRLENVSQVYQCQNLCHTETLFGHYRQLERLQGASSIQNIRDVE